MIYLFEDRIGRMQQFLKNNLDSEFIKIALIDCQKENLINHLSSEFSDSSAIIFHSSYSFNDNSITNEDVKKYFCDNKIPFIYFSGGLNNNLVIENGITNGNVNSGDMYNNLTYFIDDYKIQKKINISLLIYGKKYLLNSLLELQAIISLYLFDKSNEHVLTSEDFNEIIDLIEVRLKENELQDDKFKLLEWLNSKNIREKLDKQTILSQIQKLNNKY